jgi:CDGSH-type Zn-finger protein
MASVPRIAVGNNGPYFLMHDMAVMPVPSLRRESGEACATVRGVGLCRCGGSKNKPFCDGTHLSIKFRAGPGSDR